LRRRETRLAKIKLAKKVVEQRAREKAAAEGKTAGEAKQAKAKRSNQSLQSSQFLLTAHHGPRCGMGAALFDIASTKR
jgi:hypothetical protein